MIDRRTNDGVGTESALLRALSRRAARVRTDLFFAGQDAALVAVSFGCILLVRFGGRVPDEAWSQYVTLLPIAITVYLATHWRAGLYGQIWRFASVLEARRLLAAGAVALAVLVVIDVFGTNLAPGSVLLAGGLFTTMLVGTFRFGARLFSSRRRDDAVGGLRVVVVGAGETAAALIREIHDHPRSGLVAVAVLDDDARKIGRTIHGVRVLGRPADLAEVCASTGAHQVVLAIPSAPVGLVRGLASAAHDADVVLRVVPASYDAVEGSLRIQDMRDVAIEDLLGRLEVRTDLAAVRSLLHARRVLVTGAGGSIGSEIVQQVAAFQPERLIALDHDETHLHDAVEQLETSGVKVDDLVTLILADIRDRELLLRIFRQQRPDVVFHAAAHKHVPMLESHPAEALRTNVVGTANVLEAARVAEVGNFVFISTDKAVRPSSVMGATKYLAEQQVLAGGHGAGGAYCAVRFGNVLGSRGSVIPTFMRQIRSGGPVTVTDARMTRFFMSTQEAVQLVLQAASMADGGEVFMLEMGEPVEILDLAKRMIRMAGRRVGEDVELRVVGVRPGEKLEEELWLPVEAPEPTAHPSVIRLHPPRLGQASLRAARTRLTRLAAEGQDDQLRLQLLEIANDPARWDATVQAGQHEVVDLRPATRSEGVAG